MSDQSELLRDLARAKAAFQLRTLELLLRDQPLSNFAAPRPPLGTANTATPLSDNSPCSGVAGNLSRESADHFAGPAHGERPVVNGKAGAARASGSTPPSGINSRGRPRDRAEPPASIRAERETPGMEEPFHSKSEVG